MLTTFTIHYTSSFQCGTYTYNHAVSSRVEVRMAILAKTFNLLRYPAMAESKKTASKGRSLSINCFSSNLRSRQPDIARVWNVRTVCVRVRACVSLCRRGSPDLSREHDFLLIETAFICRRISQERCIGSPPNMNCLFLTSDGTRGACRLLRATSIEAYLGP